MMRWDAWVSCAIYTTATVAFYLLGAATLHSAGLEVGDAGMVDTLSKMYESAFGPTGAALFKVGCFCVLFSTVFGATAANARLFADAVPVFGIRQYASDDERHAMVKVGCVVLLVLSFVIFALFGKPVTLVFMGAFAQGALLPFLALASIYLLLTRVDRRLHPGLVWKGFLVLAASCMMFIGAYKAVEEVGKLFTANDAATESAEPKKPQSEPAK